MRPYLHNNIINNYLRSTKNLQSLPPFKGVRLGEHGYGGQSRGHRVPRATAWGWARRRESNGGEGTQAGPPHFPASPTASEGQNSCRNQASKFPEFREPVRQAPRQGCGQSCGGEGKRNSSAFCSWKVLRAALHTLPGLQLSISGPQALADTKVPCSRWSVTLVSTANLTDSRIA